MEGITAKEGIGAAMSLAGTLFEASGADRAASGAQAAAARRKAALDFEAAQLRGQAGQSVAAGQHAAREKRRQAELVQSRAIAVAAASGGGVSDPTIVNMLGKIAGEGAYRANLSLYEGEERARVMRMNAAARDYEGALALEAGDMASEAYGIQKGASLLKGASSLFSKYGGKFDGVNTGDPWQSDAADNWWRG